jgi:anti-anti-sigma factor
MPLEPGSVLKTCKIVAHMEEGDVLTLVFSGDLESAPANRLGFFLKDLFFQGRAKILVDCTDLHYITSRGVGEFLGALSFARKLGGDMKFYNLLGQPRMVFETLGLLMVIKTYTDRQQALEAFNKPPDSDDEQSLQEGLEESAAEGRFALSLFQASMPATEALSHRPAFHFALLPGESAFHRLDCELLAGRSDREKILLRSDNKLDLLGLTPCRTCIRKGPSDKEHP